MVDIFRVPSWLSIKPDANPGCGGGTLGQSYRPKDYAVWQQLLSETVHYFKEIELASRGTKIYYQFWNEPDLICNWQEGTPEFLELYEQTMPYIKSIHNSAKVGGSGIGYWDGRIHLDGDRRSQNLNFDLIQFTKGKQLPMGFVTFHYFSYDYQHDFIEGVDRYRSFLTSLDILEESMPIILNEWLPHSGIPNGFNPNQAADAANLFVAMHQVGLPGQGGVPWQDYGPAPEDEWGLVTYRQNKKKPMFFVYQFFDEISRSSLGISYKTDPVLIPLLGTSSPAGFKIGEHRQVISKLEKPGCYKMAVWNRIVSPLEAAISYLFEEGVILSELQAAYGTDDVVMLSALETAIQASQAFAPEWSSAFVQANHIYGVVDTYQTANEFKHEISFPDAKNIVSVRGDRLGHNDVSKQAAVITTKANTLFFALRPQEILLSEICLQ